MSIGTHFRYRAWVLLAVLLSLALLPACGKSTPRSQATQSTAAQSIAPTTDRAVAQRDEDLVLIRNLYYGASKAWYSGYEAGIDFMVTHDYPDYHFTRADCSVSSPAKNYAESYVVDAASVARDDAFIVPGGKLKGLHPQGRIYILNITTTVTSDESASDTTQDSRHVAIIGTTAYFFQDCSL